jgi:hypothetical protein
MARLRYQGFCSSSVDRPACAERSRSSEFAPLISPFDFDPERLRSSCDGRVRTCCREIGESYDFPVQAFEVADASFGSGVGHPSPNQTSDRQYERGVDLHPGWPPGRIRLKCQISSQKQGIRTKAKRSTSLRRRPSRTKFQSPFNGGPARSVFFNRTPPNSRAALKTN